VKTRSGLHILKVVKKSLVSDPQLDARREEIRGILFGETFRRQFRAWLDQRRDETFIRIND
jgi:peptidyl-prolyl cis-trans isomerase SurA